MKFIPVLEKFLVQPDPGALSAVDRLASELAAERPEFQADDDFRNHRVQTLADGPALHLDDLSEIAYPPGRGANGETSWSSSLDHRLAGLFDGRGSKTTTLPPFGGGLVALQDRARLRAGDGDLIATCSPAVEGYEEYCRDWLGLGAPGWLSPRPTPNPLQVAHACWEDRAVRRTLVHLLRSGQLTYLHPHMGTLAVWELAVLLHRASRRPVKVIAPTPSLSRWVNDKIAFANAVTRLFGCQFIPTTASSWNLSTLSQEVKNLASQCQAIGIKLPNSAGGGGNTVLDAQFLRGRELHEIHDVLKLAVASLGWDGTVPLLVDRWETAVLSAPSAQLWIPPEADGPPVVEGLFVQLVEEREGVFVGATRANFPEQLTRELAQRCWLLGRLFQRLGYVGRCSFDMMLVGEHLEDCRLEFVECNGRWGGTSLPMTLMNRLFGDWLRQPFAIRTFCRPGLEHIGFPQLLELLGENVYHHRTETGRLVFFNPGRMRVQSEITVIALGSTWTDAAELIGHEVPALLDRIASGG